MSGYEPLLRSAAAALGPLERALADVRGCRRLLREVGWPVNLSSGAFEQLKLLLPVAAPLGRLPALVEALDGGDAAAVLALADAIGEIVRSIGALASLDTAALEALPGPLADPVMWSDLAAALPDHLLGRWMAIEVPVLRLMLRLLGVCVSESRGGTWRDRFRWDRLGAALADPGAAIKTTVGWGAEFQDRWLQHELSLALARLGLPVRARPRRQAVADAIAGQPVASVSGLEYELLFFDSTGPNGLHAEAGLVLCCTRDASGTIYFGNLAHGAWSSALQITESWQLLAKGNLEGSATLCVRLQPGGVGLVTIGPSLSDSVEASMTFVGQPAEPWLLFGDPSGLHIELSSALVTIGVAGSIANPEIYLDTNVPAPGFSLVIVAAKGDSFLRNILGDADLRCDVGVELRWSSLHGLTLSGSAGLDVTIPVHRDLKVLIISQLHLAITASGAGGTIQADVNGSLILGPFVVVVEEIGLCFDLIPLGEGDTSGAFGNLDLTARFKPPTGLGVEIDSTFASGGGFLRLDEEVGEYSGVLDVNFMGIELTATGVLATRIKGAEGKWSWYLNLAATFTGLQLGFGFVLKGVGGLVGVNRALDVDALSAGLRDGALDAILFPEDPLADAPRIMSQIGTIFPPAIGQYVFGPMVKIGWGTRSLVDLDLGVVIQLPDPLTVTLLGSLSSVLPRANLALLALHIDVAGTANLTEGTLAIDASLRDSQLLGIAITGDAAIRASFRDAPSFCMAFGGFHPAFEPPAGFPSLKRLGFSLESGDDLRLLLGCYFAVTSNTVQVGAEVSLWARSSGFTIEGGLSFDALLELSPFGFKISMGMYCSVSAGSFELLGVYVSGTLAGPRPWRVLGKATFKAFGASKDIRINTKIGSARPEAKPSIDVAELVREALLEDGAWLEVLPDGTAGAVTITDDSGGAVHPAGGLEVRQRIAPLELTLERYGSADVVGSKKITMIAPTIDDVPAEAGDDVVDDWFATGQYLELSDAEQLGAPSFERMSCGLRFSTNAVDAPEARGIALGYEQILLDPKLEVGRKLTAPHRVTTEALAGMRSASSVVRQRGRASLTVSSRTKPLAFGLSEPGWAVAPTAAAGLDLTRTAAAGGSWARGRQAARGTAGVAVVPRYEREEAE